MDFERMPVAPGGDGWLGHNAAFRKNRMGTLRLLAQCPTPLMRLRLPFPGIRAAAANDPDVIQEVLVEKARSFEKSDMLRFALWNLAGEGLFTSNGDLWRRQRRIMAPLFTPKALEAYAADMVACALRTAEAWGDGEELPLARETTRLTMAVAGKTLFDADTFSEADEIGAALTVALEWTGYVIGRPLALSHIGAKRLLEHLAAGARGPASALLTRGARRFQGPVALLGERGRALTRAIALLDEHVQGMIDERRRAGGGGSDLLTRLLQARDDDGATMSDRQVRDEVLTLFVAGHETTATGLAWTLHEACRHPEIYAAMVREADAASDPPGVADLPRLDLCLRAFKEALRLYPPVYAFGRDNRVLVRVGGYDLPAPTNVLTSPWVLHHAARFWPDPDRFDPSRFLPEHEATRHRYVYLPFGAGPRVCLGNHFAYMEAQLALAVLLQRYDFDLLGEDQPEPLATLRPRDGVRVRVRRRRRSKVFTGEVETAAIVP
jgi:cytochrome P450